VKRNTRTRKRSVGFLSIHEGLSGGPKKVTIHGDGLEGFASFFSLPMLFRVLPANPKGDIKNEA